MVQGHKRLSGAPIWAWTIMAVAAVMIMVTAPVAFGRGGKTLSADELARLDAAEAAARASDAQNADVPVLVIGDSYTAGSTEGGNGSAGWPAMVQRTLQDEGRNVVFDIRAAGGSGYTQDGTSGQRFVDLAAQSAEGYKLAVVFGSRNDRATPEEVTAAAESLYREVLSRAPTARLLIVGPPWVDASPPAFIEDDRDGVAAAASALSARFVDPLSDGWFADRTELIGEDGVHPTDEGHQYMAELMVPLLREELDQITT
jgi:lysophospholipase L1-like esterase